ncbi:hypothetical protein ACSQ67_000989 [Phaseolus vulgaris]
MQDNRGREKGVGAYMNKAKELKENLQGLLQGNQLCPYPIWSTLHAKSGRREVAIGRLEGDSVQGEKCVTDSNSDDGSNQRGGDNRDEQIATLGEEEGAKEASYVIPIRHRRRKGLWELGKSGRRSQGKIRLEAINISDESCRDSRVNKISNIVSDGDIAKGNSRM